MPRRKTRKSRKKSKWGKLGPPHSAKRKRWMAHIRHKR